MNPSHSGLGKTSALDWMVSLGLHSLLLFSVVWGLSSKPATRAAYVPLDLAVSWAAPQVPSPAPVAKPLEPVVQPKRLPVQSVVRKEVAPSPVAAPDVVVPAAPVLAPIEPSPAPPEPQAQARPAPLTTVAAPAAPKVDEQPRWHNHLEAMLIKHKHYPMSARRMRQEGVVTIEAHFSAQGEVVRCLVAISSGFKALDEAALQLVRQAAELTRQHKQPGRVSELQIPIVYELKES